MNRYDPPEKVPAEVLPDDAWNASHPHPVPTSAEIVDRLNRITLPLYDPAVRLLRRLGREEWADELEREGKALAAGVRQAP